MFRVAHEIFHSSLLQSICQSEGILVFKSCSIWPNWLHNSDENIWNGIQPCDLSLATSRPSACCAACAPPFTVTTYIVVQMSFQYQTKILISLCNFYIVIMTSELLACFVDTMWPKMYYFVIFPSVAPLLQFIKYHALEGSFLLAIFAKHTILFTLQNILSLFAPTSLQNPDQLHYIQGHTYWIAMGKPVNVNS